MTRREPWDRNRWIATRSKAVRSGWCICDRIQVRNWVKCSLCNRRNGKYRAKPKHSLLRNGW